MHWWSRSDMPKKYYSSVCIICGSNKRIEISHKIPLKLGHENYGFDLPLLETIGYREARDVLNNNSSIDKAIELTTTKTIQFAKRQKTWFRNKNNPIWLNNKNLLKDAIINIEFALR